MQKLIDFDKYDLICLSHLRWNFVLQRPQHLMNRFARNRRVFFIEEPVWEDGSPKLDTYQDPGTGVEVVTPKLPPGLTSGQIVEAQRELLHQFTLQRHLQTYIAWYYTPMAVEFASVLNPALTVYDCMDELTGFAGAPPAMKANEAALFRQADLVFTGGASLFSSKRSQHSAVYQFPSSVDTAHFERAHAVTVEPADQLAIPRPRLGYAGVIDERMNLALIDAVARARPDWHFVLLGPIAKIDASLIPALPNVHLLGMKPYSELPNYFASWDIGILPFALNEATRYISPTKTPEYLAAGLRVISTPIRDVVSPYGELGLASIVDGPDEFVAAAESILAQPKPEGFAERVQQFLRNSSWDKTWSEMDRLINDRLAQKQLSATQVSIAITHGEAR